MPNRRDVLMLMLGFFALVVGATLELFTSMQRLGLWISMAGLVSVGIHWPTSVLIWRWFRSRNAAVTDSSSA